MASEPFSGRNYGAPPPGAPNQKKTWNNRPRKSGTNHSNQNNHQKPRFRNKVSSQEDGSSSSNYAWIYRFQKLEELSKKDPTGIVLELTGQRSRFEQLLDSDLSYDSVVLVIKILAKACSLHLNTSKANIMALAYRETFHNSLRDFAYNLIKQDAAQRRRNSYFWKDPKGFFRNVAVVFRGLIETVPSKAYEVMTITLKVFEMSMTMVSEVSIDEEIMGSFNKIKGLLELCKVEAVDETPKTKREEDNDDNVEPPDDFRSINIYPNRDDVLLHRGFLRKNLIDKGYQSVDHYLDVQFRLLREDFVGPLREGITEYMQYKGQKKQVIKVSDVRVYADVQFLNPVSTPRNLGVLLQIQSMKNQRQMKIHSNKRFMYGSLLCFTRDNFNTFLVGTVLERTPELLQKGQIVVGFEAEQDNYVFGEPYVMVECSVYFEPYYQVLKALQKISEEQFPLRKYIIDLASDIDDISYLDPTSTYIFNERTANIYNFEEWPNADALRLNPSQYQAFRTALTKELVVIQGPPGTGKTFLGLKIAKMLINNKEYWHKDSPMLVVCYTNHALDQFLEGLENTTSDIVRVGGQSKNPNMAKFSLKEKQKQFRRSYMDFSALISVERDVYEYLTTIKYYNEILTGIDENSIVLNFKDFRVIDENFSTSWFSRASNAQMLEWLMDGNNQVLKTPKVFEQFESNTTMDEEDLLEEEFNRVLNDQFREEHEFEADFLLKANSYEPLFSVEEYTKSIKEIDERLKSMEIDEHLKIKINEHLKMKIVAKRIQLNSELFNSKVRLDFYGGMKVENKPERCNLDKPHKMSMEDRWKLYYYWLGLYKQFIIKNLNKLKEKYKIVREQYDEIKDLLNLQIMKRMLVIGMTTTCAARLQTVLMNLKNPIVIVEEAAEVLESHVVTCLTSHCKHLILIGDHQQLRPSTSNYYIERHYNLGISLFERMVRNNLRCHVLDVQHRMRPEIANLIVPAIYPKLDNHPSVYDFPPILGIVRNMFFIDHRFPEQESHDCSKLNRHEAEYFIALAQYLVQNGYKPQEITILAAYSAQMFELWKEQKKCLNLLDGVKITVLDNYQGEENKIVLLSLVRNNEGGKIGFLKIENRVCVALSRAREGFYIMGNIDLLCQNSQIWPKIREVLERQDSLGPSLLLRCQIHPDKETVVTLPKDFEKVAEGGCSLICDALLTCGHSCTMLCHVLDRTHEKYKCKADCSKTCPYGHPCKNFCYQKCRPCQVLMKKTLSCTHEHKLYCYVEIQQFKCPTLVETKLLCGHIDPNKPCFQSVEAHKCPFPCETRVEPCGHACLRVCHFFDDPDHLEYKCQKPCERPRDGCSTGDHKCLSKCSDKCQPCEVIIQKRRSCTHGVKVACNKDPEEIPCNQKCKRLLPCGHACKKKCMDVCGDCDVKVTKTSPCGHEIKVKCSETPKREHCYNKCTSVLSCGHVCRNRCNQVCTTVCKQLVDHDKLVACLHKFKIQCHMKEKPYLSTSHDLLRLCNQRCQQILSCSHPCSGTCGECAQGRIHKVCGEKCGATLVCGHPCPINCRDACQPCEKECTFRCRHSVCRKKCGEPCTKCRERCLRACPHGRCTALCGDICTIPPCNEPCQRKLPCGHPCVGFCGDACPSLCRQCNYDELTEIFFGTEDEEDARFVMLDECKHVFESSGLDEWMKEEEGDQVAVAPKCCPRCKTVITSTQRYSDHIKRTLQSLFAVKEKYFGDRLENEKRREELSLIITRLKEEKQLMEGTSFNTVLQIFIDAISPEIKGRRKPVNLMLYQVYLGKLQTIEDIVEIYKNGKTKSSRLLESINFLFSMLMRNEKRLSKQESGDLRREGKRFALLVQCEQLDQLKRTTSNPEYIKMLQNIKIILNSITVFNDISEESVKKDLHYLAEKFKKEISQMEFREVINAMDMAKGHWFKCPNGHVYAIGECGGAMQKGKCADCGAAIGGTSHRLLDTNRHAGEVDGSGFAAYSEMANNLNNWQLDF